MSSVAAYKKFIKKHGMNLFSRDDEAIAKRSFEAGYEAATPPAPAPALLEPLAGDEYVSAKQLIEALGSIRLGLGAGGLGEGMMREVEIGSIILDACLDKVSDLLAPARPTAPAATAEAAMLAAVERFDQISNGDTLLIRGNIDGAQWHCFPNIQKKNTPHDGQGVILKKKGNVYFNFGMYAAGDSWVKECFLLTSPTPPTK